MFHMIVITLRYNIQHLFKILH